MRPLLFVLLTLLLAACSSTAHYPVNPAVHERDQNSEYRSRNLDTAGSSDSLALVLSFSGGGTRAAALSHGVLEELAATHVAWEGRDRVLLDEVDVISAVSGGSITAAHFALKRDQHFAEFPQRFLYQDMQGSITDQIFSFGMLSQLWSSNFGRIEVVASKLDDALFQGATFNDLMKRRQKPFLILNATDMSTGTGFAFTQEQFDLLCADLNAMPLARAVAASAAVPVVFSPLTLKNYASTCTNPTQNLVRKEWPNLPARQQQRLHELRSYLDDKRRPYVHLVDGGLVDNIGIWGSLDSTLLSGGAAGLMREMGFEKLRKVVFIVVAAETDPSLEADLSPEVPSVRRVAQALADIPINRISRESLILFRETTAQWRQEFKRKLGSDVAFYLIEVSLRDIADEAERERFRAIPTTLALPKADVDQLRSLGRRLLRDAPEMKRLLHDMAANR